MTITRGPPKLATKSAGDGRAFLSISIGGALGNQSLS
jgi:hypothetical protein